MNEDNTATLGGMEILDATQNAVIEAVDNVSDIISETTVETPSDFHHHEVFYKEAEFWVGFAFILVVIFLSKPVGKLLKSMLLKRRNEIADKILQAETLQDEAQKLLAEYERKYLNAEDEADAVLKKSQNQIELTRQTESRKLDAELNQKRREADGIIATAQRQTLDEINEKTTLKALKITKSYLADHIDEKLRSQMIDESIINICQKLTK